MTGQRIDVEERAAAAIVSWELAGWWQPRDIPGAPEGTHDLDVHVLAGGTVALEVTSAGDRSLIKLRELVFGEPWEAPALEHHWWLGLSERPQPQIKRLKQKTPQYLAVLEQSNVAQVSTHEPLPAGSPPEVMAAAQAIFALGAHRATRLDTPKAGETAQMFSSLGSGRSGGADSLNGIVEACARGKVKKLRAAEGDEKHLFVWLRADAHETVEVASSTLAISDAPPTLPEGIDVAWVGIGPSNPASASLAVLRVRTCAAWERIRVPSPLGDS